MGVKRTGVRRSPACPRLELGDVSGVMLQFPPDCPGRKNTATCPCCASSSPWIVQCACGSRGNGTEASFAGDSDRAKRKIVSACVDEVSFAGWQDLSGPVRGDAFSGMVRHGNAIPSAPEVAQHRAQIHACLLVAGDSQNHDREIKRKECCHQLDFVFHRSRMTVHSDVRE